MKVIVHRGTREVGGTCIEVAHGKTRIILDVGLPLFGPNREPLDNISLGRLTKAELKSRNLLPSVPGLFDGDAPPDAVLLTHGHLDHTGLIGHTKECIPVFTSRGTSKMMLAGELFARQVGVSKERWNELFPGEAIEVGELTIWPYSVDHSIYGCLAFVIEGGGKRVCYTGDLRGHGRKPGMHQTFVENLAKDRLDVLLMEGTHCGLPDGPIETEYELEERLFRTIETAESLVLASFSPQHVDRLVGFLKAARRSDRTFVADLYTAFVLHLIHTEVSVPHPREADWLRVYVPNRFRNDRRFRRLIELFRGDQIELSRLRQDPAGYVMMFRPSLIDEFETTLPRGTCCIYSRWPGYLEGADWQRVRRLLSELGGDLQELHTSGHIHSTDIEPFVRKVAPGAVIPVHTFEPNQFHDWFENVVDLADGEPFVVERIDSDGFQ